MSAADVYATLGIPKNAAQDDVKKAYRSLAMKWHPDKNPANKEEAERRFKEIAHAYEILSDPQKRAAYDHQSAYGGLGGTGWSGSSNFPTEYDFKFRDPDDVFREFFGGKDPFEAFFGDKDPFKAFFESPEFAGMPGNPYTTAKAASGRQRSARPDNVMINTTGGNNSQRRNRQENDPINWCRHWAYQAVNTLSQRVHQCCRYLLEYRQYRWSEEGKKKMKKYFYYTLVTSAFITGFVIYLHYNGRTQIKGKGDELLLPVPLDKTGANWHT